MLVSTARVLLHWDMLDFTAPAMLIKGHCGSLSKETKIWPYLLRLRPRPTRIESNGHDGPLRAGLYAQCCRVGGTSRDMVRYPDFGRTACTNRDWPRSFSGEMRLITQASAFMRHQRMGM